LFYQTCALRVLKIKWTDFDAYWHQWSMGQGHQSTLGVRRSKVKVRLGRKWIWRPGGGVILDALGRPFGSTSFFSLVKFCHCQLLSVCFSVTD